MKTLTEFMILISITGNIIFSTWLSGAERETITEQQAIMIANQEVKRLGRALDRLEMDVDRTWELFRNRNPRLLEHYPNAAARIRGRMYWAITYGPKDPMIRGGGLTIFVDKETGNILAVIRYE
ncbi:MAG: hypothetical protein AB1555_07190 [Nitrospirota bacterium]